MIFLTGSTFFMVNTQACRNWELNMENRLLNRINIIYSLVLIDQRKDLIEVGLMSADADLRMETFNIVCTNIKKTGN